MKRRAALAIARDLRAAERIIEDPALLAVRRREAERLIASVLARLIDADDTPEAP